MALCDTCSFRTCLDRAEKPHGTIRAGVPYNEKGKVAPTCDQCGQVLTYPDGGGPPHCVPCGFRRAGVAAHHDQIAELRSRKPRPTWKQVAEIVGFNAEAVRVYWNRYCRTQAAPKPESSQVSIS
jgi:hypothetical protein